MAHPSACNGSVCNRKSVGVRSSSSQRARCLTAHVPTDTRLPVQVASSRGALFVALPACDNCAKDETGSTSFLLFSGRSTLVHVGCSRRAGVPGGWDRVAISLFRCLCRCSSQSRRCPSLWWQTSQCIQCRCTASRWCSGSSAMSACRPWAAHLGRCSASRDMLELGSAGMTPPVGPLKGPGATSFGANLVIEGHVKAQTRLLTHPSEG